MISGAHIILYSKDAEADRAFFRDILGFPFVDAGRGWLLFALPPAEAAFHPSDHNRAPQLYLMCADIETELKELAAKGVVCSLLENERWGSITRITLPGGGKVCLYEPRHPTAFKTL